MEHARLLIADDEAEIRTSYAELLAAAGHQTDQAVNGEEVLERVAGGSYDMVLLDFQFPPTDGARLLQQLKSRQPSLLVVIVTGHATVGAVLDAFRYGAFDVVEKPLDRQKLLRLAERAVEIRSMGEKRRKLAEELESERLNVVKLRQQLGDEDPFARIVGPSDTMQQLQETIREVARTDSTVLLTGESGTGKGLVAHTIHEASSRCEGPFVEANCVVYSEGVLHSELFGHERGAFTGAARTKKGRFELSRGGTLFLDEIGEISAATQLLLLRVLQDRTFERVGGEETLETDVRLIAATNRNLAEAIEQGSFRSDLYYRLNVIPVHLPPLREHAEDIPVLAQYFVKRCAARTEREAPELDPVVTDALSEYSWPGNVRELENMIERLVVLNRSGVIGPRELPDAVKRTNERTVGPRSGTLQDMERLRIIDALSDAGGNKKLAAKKLGIHRSTLYAKLRRYGLDECQSRPGDAEPARQQRAGDSVLVGQR